MLEMLRLAVAGAKRNHRHLRRGARELSGGRELSGAARHRVDQRQSGERAPNDVGHERRRGAEPAEKDKDPFHGLTRCARLRARSQYVIGNLSITAKANCEERRLGPSHGSSLFAAPKYTIELSVGNALLGHSISVPKLSSRSGIGAALLQCPLHGARGMGSDRFRARHAARRRVRPPRAPTASRACPATTISR